MRQIFFLILTFGLFFNSLKAQEDNISKEKWEAIVDYANAKVTLIYIDALFQSGQLKKKDSDYYLDTLKPELSKSSLLKPFNLPLLFDLLSPEFDDTYNNLSDKINGLKYDSKNLNTLNLKLKEVLGDVRKRDLYDSEAIKSLQLEIKSYAQKKPQEIQSINSVPNEDPNKSEMNSSFFTISNFIIAILTLLIFGLLFMNNNKDRKIHEQKSRIKTLENNLNYERSVGNGSQNTSNKDRKRIIELEEELRKIKDIKVAPKKNQSTSKSELEKPMVVDFGKPKSPASPKVFYAGKPTPEGKFLETTESIKDQETVYKFTYDDSNRNKAIFEVILASEFMKRQIPNSPDDFLYRVCNNVNSNQDFRQDIITERKGIAHLKDGVWVVEDSEKALIKFQ